MIYSDKHDKSKLSVPSYHNDRGGYNHSGGYQAILTTPTERQKSIKSRNNNNNKDMLSIKTMSYCSRYDSCDAPKCPLDILIDSRIIADGDPKCGMAKATRHKYYLSMPEELKNELPYEGYFKAEYSRMKAARERWESMNEEQKNELIERMKTVRAAKEVSP